MSERYQESPKLIPNARELVTEPFPDWVKNDQNRDTWLQYPFTPEDDKSMMQQAESLFENPYGITARTLYAVTIRYERLQERNYSPKEAPARILHAYRKGLDAFARISEEQAGNPEYAYLLKSLTTLFSDQSVFVQQLAINNEFYD